jgi:cysteinyl-tRNA synthetase
VEKPLRLYNTLTRRIEDLVPAEPGHVRMYVCGMTVYDYCHIGHARAMITFDVVHRHLLHRGFTVDFVRNHTDVDDKIIRRAAAEGVPALELSARFIQALQEDLKGLGLLPPTAEPKVSEHIPEIIDLVGRIVAQGHGYPAGGDVYFSVESYRSYGQLSGRSVEDLHVGDQADADPKKRHPADFALWKAAQPGEPAWESPWGPGRPGWHIECSAMSMKYLGERFDIHGGGSDLVFPHHENEIAQSECGTGLHPFVRYWMHNGMVTLAEEKMSKSLGNIITIREILREIPGETLKLLYLGGAHYRNPVPYSTEALAEALVALDRLYQAREAADEGATRVEAGVSGDLNAIATDFGEPGRDLLRCVDDFSSAFDGAMDDDFSTPGAVALLFDLVRHTNRFAALPKARVRGAPLLAKARTSFALAADVLGVGAAVPLGFFEEMKGKRLAAMGLERAWVEDRLEARAAARHDRNWPLADQIRSELDARSIIVMDGPQGSNWRVRV